MSAVIRRNLITTSAVLVVSMICTGCKYDGSTLQMNSDSPSPFLGLQWSVKNNQPKPKRPDVPMRLVRADYARADDSRVDEKPVSDQDSVDLTAPLIADNRVPDNTLVPEDRTSNELIPDSPRRESGRPSNLVPTSDSQRATGRVRYSLERTSDSSANLADEMSIRLRQF